jgi:hypothetical protein
MIRGKYHQHWSGKISKLDHFLCSGRIQQSSTEMSEFGSYDFGVS